MTAAEQGAGRTPTPITDRLKFYARKSEVPNPDFEYIHADVCAQMESDRARLIEALAELQEAELAQFPFANEGQQAQDAWAERKVKAHDSARALLRSLNERGA